MGEFSPRKAINIPASVPRNAIAVLVSGGLQSAILTAYLLEEFELVYPLYVQLGLPQERAEEQQLRRFLAAIRNSRLGRLAVLEKITDSSFGSREQQLLSRAANWCTENGITSMAMATLEPCKTKDLPTEITGSINIISPFATISRASVLELGRGLPLEFTFSCSRPIIKGLLVKHCGQCPKCQMRRLGLASIHINDRTPYVAYDKAQRAVSINQ